MTTEEKLITLFHGIFNICGYDTYGNNNIKGESDLYNYKVSYILCKVAKHQFQIGHEM